jgi:CheY-like chemotaxis protein
MSTGLRAADLTRQLLAFSRKQVLQPKVLDLNAVVSGMAAMLRRLIGEHIDLVTALPPGLGAVRADRAQIEQVIVNLAVNARDAMPRRGTLTIETGEVELDAAFLRLHPGAAPGPYVLLAVRDTGSGMDDHVRAHLFEPFFTTKEPGRGTGLGLATVYGIVKQHDGVITVDSVVGTGTIVHVYLPRVAAAVTVESAAPAASNGHETILLVEDEVELRRMAEEILSRRGYRVLAAAPDAAFATAEGHRGRIDLLVTDVVMPGVSGREVADRLVRLRPETKVLYISGYAGEALGRHGVLDDHAHLLAKPFLPADLLRKVREVLDR